MCVWGGGVRQGSAPGLDPSKPTLQASGPLGLWASLRGSRDADLELQVDGTRDGQALEWAIGRLTTRPQNQQHNAQSTPNTRVGEHCLGSLCCLFATRSDGPNNGLSIRGPINTASFFPAMAGQFCSRCQNTEISNLRLKMARPEPRRPRGVRHHRSEPIRAHQNIRAASSHYQPDHRHLSPPRPSVWDAQSPSKPTSPLLANGRLALAGCGGSALPWSRSMASTRHLGQ
ncbi:hypothetical protein B0H67DRAFT_77772 [Lasiosphaeris hirsuta]|uniref:Uncharacterized protein n=1 Tax=Lasiosphaeris hirsuta TaxID=260670 RepID=A0AA40EDP5_9PEZI|nr:hypothetical protein B0H67DRAFT_77772 [Lasiosphaeris hirsuta]